MSNDTINKSAILFGLVLSFFSLLVALLSNGDILYIITMRFLLVFLVSAVLAWATLTVVNSVVVRAARESINELSKILEEEDRLSEEASNSSQNELLEAIVKGQNLDLTSLPQEDLDLAIAGDEENPEIKTFEPFKPRRIETDKNE